MSICVTNRTVTTSDLHFSSIIASMIAQAIKVTHLLEADKQRLLRKHSPQTGVTQRYDFSHIVATPVRCARSTTVTQVARTKRPCSCEGVRHRKS